MRKNFGAKPLLYPQPVFIIATYGEDGTPNAMNAAWGGITESDELTVCISEDHKTTENILARGAFTVSMADGIYRAYSRDGEFLMLAKVESGTMSTIKSFWEV